VDDGCYRDTSRGWTSAFRFYEEHSSIKLKELLMLQENSKLPFLSKHFKFDNHAGRQWLMPVILATQEAEIRRIAV
jgi:hypothetical protein